MRCPVAGRGRVGWAFPVRHLQHDKGRMLLPTFRSGLLPVQRVACAPSTRDISVQKGGKGAATAVPVSLRRVCDEGIDAVGRDGAGVAGGAVGVRRGSNAKRIALVGFSCGGMATRLAMDSRVTQALAH